MNPELLSAEFSKKIDHLYQRMEKAYDEVADALDFSCTGCPDNCCDSFFMHHTYLEWAYLWEGLRLLDPEQLSVVEDRARQYVLDSERLLLRGERPQLMCPLNEKGRCMIYTHRLMICRMHGVPSRMTRPDGQIMEFPGCFRCQEMVAFREEVPAVDRTSLYKELAGLERELLGRQGRMLPRIKLTIAQMIVKGPPPLTR